MDQGARVAERSPTSYLPEKERAGPLPAAEGGEARCAGGPGRHKLAAEPPARPPPLPPLPFLPGTRLPGACSLGTLPPPPPPRRAHHGTAPTPLLLATALRLGARLLGPPIQGKVHGRRVTENRRGHPECCRVCSAGSRPGLGTGAPSPGHRDAPAPPCRAALSGPRGGSVPRALPEGPGGAQKRARGGEGASGRASLLRRRRGGGPGGSAGFRGGGGWVCALRCGSRGPGPGADLAGAQANSRQGGGCWARRRRGAEPTLASRTWPGCAARAGGAGPGGASKLPSERRSRPRSSLRSSGAGGPSPRRPPGIRGGRFPSSKRLGILAPPSLPTLHLVASLCCFLCVLAPALPQRGSPRSGDSCLQSSRGELGLSAGSRGRPTSAIL